jgi:hypothetical protein
MTKELLITIDSYLNGELSDEELVSFEKRVREEYGIQEDVALTTRLIKGIRGYGFKQLLSKIHREEFGNDLDE